MSIVKIPFACMAILISLNAVWFSDSGQACIRRSGVSSNESAAIDLLLGCAGVLQPYPREHCF